MIDNIHNHNNANAHPIEILYQDDHLVAVNKPAGMLVHRSHIDHYETQFVLQTVRDQIQQKVYLIHRLDKPTSGVLLLALSPQTVEIIQSGWDAVEKTYLAVVRGFFPQSIIVDKPLKTIDPFGKNKHSGSTKSQLAVTRFYNLAQCEFDIAVDRYPTTRYSLIKAIPENGRKHQIRRHLKHLSHPIIGDSAYGKSKHNRFFQQHFTCHRLLLHCQQITFTHPYSQSPIIIHANTDASWHNLPMELQISAD